jgi:hypothetical protein
VQIDTRRRDEFAVAYRRCWVVVEQLIIAPTMVPIVCGSNS